MSSDLFTDDLGTLSSDELFAAIQDFVNTQQTEGWRHDYTEQWDDSSLKNVAAFANTFGGLLIVGVKKGMKDVACELTGIDSESEYKTRIASAIAANISPVPPYSVFECLMPGVPNKRFCVVRVRETRALHLITKKNFDPVYVRNEDEARKADAAQLRRLIDREREMPLATEKVNERANQLRNALVIGSGYQKLDGETWDKSPHQVSQTFLKLELMPTDISLLEMEKFHEEWLKKAIGGIYPRFRETVFEGVANQAESRGADFYEYTVYHKKLDYEARWRITGQGDIGHATQMNYRSVGVENVWSVVDLANFVVLFIEVAMKWWGSISYYGDGRVFAHLNIPGLSILRHPEHGYFTHAFNPTYTPSRLVYEPSFRKDAILLAPLPGNAANAETRVTYFSGKRSSARLTTSILNQLLRSLGHGVAWNLLESEVAALVADRSAST